MQGLTKIPLTHVRFEYVMFKMKLQTFNSYDFLKSGRKEEIFTFFKTKSIQSSIEDLRINLIINNRYTTKVHGL